MRERAFLGNHTSTSGGNPEASSFDSTTWSVASAFYEPMDRRPAFAAALITVTTSDSGFALYVRGFGLRE
jgi:hypothetical protein